MAGFTHGVTRLMRRPFVTHSASASVQGSIDVNVVNINESPICPHMIETQSYTIIENSRPGTILSSNRGHYAAASADYVSDDSNGDISYTITDNIIGRMFIEAADTSCELNNSALLRDGIFSNVWSKESCKKSATGENPVEAGNM